MLYIALGYSLRPSLVLVTANKLTLGTRGGFTEPSWPEGSARGRSKLTP